MKGWELAVAILVLGTMTISPKADAKNLLKTQQVVAQVPNSQAENSKSGLLWYCTVPPEHPWISMEFSCT